MNRATTLDSLRSLPTLIPPEYHLYEVDGGDTGTFQASGARQSAVRGKSWVDSSPTAQPSSLTLGKVTTFECVGVHTRVLVFCCLINRM